jgi:hypothetical protein
MKEDFISREEYQEAMKRVHERIDKSDSCMAKGIKDMSNIISDGISGLHSTVLGTAVSVGKMEGSINAMSKLVDKMHEAVFGNGKPGALTRITQVWTKVKIQWWLIAGSFTCIGLIVMAFIDHLSK